MPITALAHAFGTLTSTGVNVANTETVTVGGKVYTFQTTLTNVDGNVKIGATAALSLANLKAAINLSGGVVGTDFATAMTVNAEVRATTITATTLKVVSKTPGTVGNFIPSTETSTVLSWGATTLASGTGSIDAAITELLATEQLNAAMIQILKRLDADSENA